MRKKWQKQMPLMPQITDHRQSKELEVISTIIDANPIICDRVLQDLNRGKNVAHRQGANGMSAEQVLRAAIVKTLYSFTYKDWPSTWSTPNR
jgi:IS5 family transposase